MSLDRGLRVSHTVRDDFPILDQEIHGKPLVYLDSAASAQKPRCVIEALREYYENEHANVHRGVHALSVRATRMFDDARRTVQRFLNARYEEEILFTKGCTEAVNLEAASWGRANLNPGDRVLLTTMEHHADIVPWQLGRSPLAGRVVWAGWPWARRIMGCPLAGVVSARTHGVTNRR